jgi:hypothetical protein
MLTVTEWAKLNPTPLESGVVEIFARNNPVLELLPFINIKGNAYKYNVEQTLPGIAFRAIRGSYTESTGVINPVTEALTIIGGDSDYDVAHIAMGTGDNDSRAVHDSLKAKALALSWLKTFFDGDNSVTGQENEFDGMNVRLTGNQVITAGANGAQLTLDMLDQLCDAVTGAPSVLLMNKAARRKIRALARNSTTLTVSRDMFGREVDAYQGVPIRVVEEDSSGADILGFDEEQGDSEVASSIYAVRFGADALHGIQTAPVSVRDLGEISAKPALRTRIEHYSGIVVKHPKSAARLKGVLAG